MKRIHSVRNEYKNDDDNSMAEFCAWKMYLNLTTAFLLLNTLFTFSFDTAAPLSKLQKTLTKWKNHTIAAKMLARSWKWNFKNWWKNGMNGKYLFDVFFLRLCLGYLDLFFSFPIFLLLFHFLKRFFFSNFVFSFHLFINSHSVYDFAFCAFHPMLHYFWFNILKQQRASTLMLFILNMRYFVLIFCWFDVFPFSRNFFAFLI